MKHRLPTTALVLGFLFSTGILPAQQPYPSQFTPQGFGGGGYMYSPSISPLDPNHFFINCDMGGIYRSQDAGQTWKMQPCQNIVSMVKGKVQFTSDPNILYTIRRSTTNLNDPLFRGELAKSADGGTTWQAMPDPTASGVQRLEVDPTSTQRLILNEYNQLFFSGNGGATWTSIFAPADDKIWLGGVFWDGQDIYVGTDHGLLVSKNGGASFFIENHPGLPTGTGIYQLVGAKSGSTLRLFCIPAPASEMFAWYEPLEFDGLRQGIFQMSYTANAAWANSRGNIPANVDLAWVDLAKNNTQIVWADGSDDNDFSMVFKSTDGGASWTNVYQTTGNQNISTAWTGAEGAFWLQQNAGALGFDVSDNDPNRVIRTRGQAELTTDGGATWRCLVNPQTFLNPAGQPTQINKQYKSSGLDVTSAHHLFWKNNNEMFLANTDVGMTYSPDAGHTWTWARNTFYDYGPVANPNWYRIVERPDNQHLFAAVSNLNDIYLGYRIQDWNVDGAHGLIVTSTDGGATFDTLHNFGHAVVWLEIDKNNPARMWASVVHSTEGGIFRSENGGQTWVKLPAPPRTQGHPYNIVSLADGGLVATFSARTLADGETLTESSGVFFSSDHGDSWEDRTAPAMKFFTKDLVIDPHDTTENTWFVTVWGRFSVWPGPNNQGNGGLYKTTDRGQTWTRIFAHETAESITIHPSKPGTAYLTTENDALFFTENLDAVQPVFEKVATYPWWRPKRVFFNPFNACEVWVTSMGGGLWKGETTGAACCTPPVVSVNDATICAGDTAILTANGADNYEWSNGETGNSISVSPGATAAYSVIGTTLGCSTSVVTVVNVNPLPTVNLGTDIILQQGQETTLDAGGNGLTYEWSTGAATPTIVVNSMGIYSVTVTNLVGCTSSDTVLVAIIVSTNDQNSQYDLSILPNPAHDLVNIIGVGSATLSVQVLDKLGRTVAEDNAVLKDGTTRILNIGQLTPGAYFIKIIGEDFIKTIPIIKQ